MTFAAVVRKMMKKGGVARRPGWTGQASCVRINARLRLEWVMVGVHGLPVVDPSISPLIVVERDWIWSES